MNTKRQTVWLVSMLSLMVVLSAYYLFTDNPSNMDTAAQKMNKHDITKVDATEVDQSADDKKTAETVGGKANKSDQQILKEVQAQGSGDDYFEKVQMAREEQLSKESERLMNIIADTKQDKTVAGKAYDDLKKLEDRQAKVMNLEEELMKDYANAVVTEDKNQWKVVVKSDKLEKSQAVSIIDLVMRELSVGADQIVVKYIS